jgi:signal transduction histidine kinase
MVLHMLLEKTLGPLNRQQDALLQTARTDAERLLRILDDFLDLARLESEKANLKRQATSPIEMVHLMMHDMRAQAAAKKLEILCTIEPNLPAVMVDRQRMEHVFQNILANAIKHSPPGSEILVRAEKTRDGSVRFSVRDQGPGIPEEYHNRIFDRLFRVPGQAKTGAGLGLFIAHEIVAAHEGSIGVESQLGHGSEFFVVLDSTAESAQAEDEHAISHPA